MIVLDYFIFYWQRFYELNLCETTLGHSKRRMVQAITKYFSIHLMMPLCRKQLTRYGNHVAIKLSHGNFNNLLDLNMAFQFS